MTDQTSTWLADQIEAHAPDRESDPSAAARLAEAYAALAGAVTATQAFGLAVPATVDNRDGLRTRALELLKLWLAKLDAETKEKIRAQMVGYGIPVGAPPAPPPEPPSDPGDPQV